MSLRTDSAPSAMPAWPSTLVTVNSELLHAAAESDAAAFGTLHVVLYLVLHVMVVVTTMMLSPLPLCSL